MGSSQVRTIYRSLRDGSVLLLAIDRNVTEAGVPVRFFDAVADLPGGPVELAMRLKVPLVPAVTYRLPNRKNVVIIRPPIEIERTGDNERDIETNLRKAVQVLEEFIIKAPDQWTVLQKVWDRDYTESGQWSVTSDRKEEELEPSLSNR
jgi:KDO2-lipid IV(A) lauroyltransferase